MKKMIEVPAEQTAPSGLLDDVFKAAPGAVVAVKVLGGYLTFDNPDEAQAFVRDPAAVVPADVVRAPLPAKV